MQFAFPLTGGKPYCPRCGSTRCTAIKTRNQYNCSDCHHRFSKTSGTAFACRKLSIREILFAIAEFQDEEDARSAHSLARKIGVTYKTAWVLAHKLRQMMASSCSHAEISEDVAIDGANFSGKLRNKNIKKKANDHRLKKFRDTVRKRWVVVVKERVSNSTVIARAFSDEQSSVDWIKEVVPKSVKIYSDEANHWTILGATHEHETINHKIAYKLGDVDTNTAESFFGTFRIAARIYRSISRGYFENYVQEQVWRRVAKKFASNLHRFFGLGSALSGLSSSLRGYWQRSLV
jgi:transposase-like protein